MANMKYVVWKRNDGYVNVSCERLPIDWNTPNGPVTFEELRTFVGWTIECIDYILEQRKLSNYKE